MSKELPLWVEFNLPVTEAEMLEIVGEPCRDFDAECSTCKAHAQFRVDGTIPCLQERDVMVHMQSNNYLVEGGVLIPIVFEPEEP